MRKLILMLLFPLMGMPVFAQQKKKHAGKKTEPVKTATVQEKMPEPASPAPVQSSTSGTGTVETPAAVDDRIFTAVEQMPEFPGGLNALRHFLAENIQYPEAAGKEGIQGTVYLQFIVSHTGQVGNVIIKRDIGGGCGKEAVRVVSGMPLWKPGRQNGRPVNVYYTLPVAFRLTEDTPKGK